MQTNRWAAGMLLVLAASGQAQNLVQNPDFNSDISGWTATGSASWNNSLNSPDSPPGGSAELYAAAGAGYVMLVQCVAISNVASSLSLTTEAYLFSDATNTTTPYAIVTAAYADPGCTDAVSYNDGVDISGEPVVANAWSRLSNAFVAVPAGYTSLSITIKTAGGLDVGHVAFDHIELTQVTDRVFGTGFESNEGYQ